MDHDRGVELRFPRSFAGPARGGRLIHFFNYRS
uniref:Uncharacterized protein n=1 Tax=Rhizophora mucronata TaxID=61149 RepID=A0A2P2PJQ8_RHIMU